MQNTLGISLGSRLIGLAVVYDGELTDFRVRTFYGAWSEVKRTEMLTMVHQNIKKYGITKIVVKVPKPSHFSQSIEDVTNDLIQLGKKLKIRVVVCTISMILRSQEKDAVKNKSSLIRSIVCKYSHQKRLSKLYAKEQNNHNPYYVKLFEAIACTEMK